MRFVAMPERNKERAELRRQLVANGKSVLMLAPRRIGKTWTMRRFEEDAENDSFDAIMYDAEKASTEEEFYRQLNREIEKNQPIKTNLWAVALERLKGIVTGDHKNSDLGRILGGLPPNQLSEAD